MVFIYNWKVDNHMHVINHKEHCEQCLQGSEYFDTVAAYDSVTSYINARCDENIATLKLSDLFEALRLINIYCEVSNTLNMAIAHCVSSLIYVDGQYVEKFNQIRSFALIILMLQYQINQLIEMKSSGTKL